MTTTRKPRASGEKKLHLKKETLKNLGEKDGVARGVKGGLGATVACANTRACPFSDVATQLHCCVVKP